MIAGRRPVVLAILAGAVVVLFAQSRTWARGRVVEGVNAGAEVSAGGGHVAAGAVALALVAAAGGVVVAGFGRRVARVGAVLVAAAGLGIVVSSVAVLRSPASGLRDQAAAQAAVSADAVTASATGWVGVGIAGGAVVCVAAVLGALSAGSWRVRVPAESGGVSVRDDEPMWDALSRGEDPTE